LDERGTINLLLHHWDEINPLDWEFTLAFPDTDEENAQLCFALWGGQFRYRPAQQKYDQRRGRFYVSSPDRWWQLKEDRWQEVGPEIISTLIWRTMDLRLMVVWLIDDSDELFVRLEGAERSAHPLRQWAVYKALRKLTPLYNEDE
jgi:hypothetical protein